MLMPYIRAAWPSDTPRPGQPMGRVCGEEQLACQFVGLLLEFTRNGTALGEDHLGGIRVLQENVARLMGHVGLAPGLGGARSCR
jgi:hypothetical protein